MSFKFTRPIIRETTAELEYSDDAGLLKTEQVTVRFRSLSTSEVRERREKEKHVRAADGVWFIVDDLEGVVIELIEADGTRNECTRDVLDSISVENLASISRAIGEAIRPKDQAAT